MSFDRAALKANAKQTIKDTRPSPIWVCLVMMVISLVLSGLSMVVSGNWDLYMQAINDPDAALRAMMYGQSSGGTGLIGWFLTTALDVMGWVLNVGLVIYMLRTWRRQGSGFGNLFDGFGVFFRAIWITILRSILLSLWSMVYALPTGTVAGVAAASAGLEAAMWVFVIGLPLLIPMAATAYSYRQAVYLMLDEPNLTCWQCVAFSRQIMRGHKWELFKLDLSFIGWGLLCIIPFAALWVMPYMNLTYTGYYEYVVSDFAAKNAPPVSPEPPAV